MRVITLGPGDGARWDAFVGPRSSAVTDLSAWRRVMSDSDGLRAHFLVVEEDGALAGALGLYEADHAVFGRYLATAAHGNDGGFFHASEAARDALLDAASALMDERGAAYLLIRGREALPGFVADRRYSAAVLDLAGGSAAVWDRALGAKTRNQVRRGQKEGFTVSTGPGEMRAFYEVFHERMRDLGSPAHGLRFYESVLANLGDRAEFFVVREGADLVGGALVFFQNGVASDYHAVALRRYDTRCPNYLLHWSMIEAACARGCASFDMGRSLDGGPNLAFKLNWGARPMPLVYNYRLRAGAALPSMDPRDLKYRVPIAVWKRLPVALTKAAGPLLMPGIL